MACLKATRQRSRRKRLHAAGDHSECVIGRCAAAVETDPGDSVKLDLPDEFGATTRAAITTLCEMPFPESDPRFLIMTVTVRLAQAFEKAPTAALASELRRNLEWLVLGQADPADKLDELRSRVAQKQADLLIRHALAVVPEAG